MLSLEQKQYFNIREEIKLEPAKYKFDMCKLHLSARYSSLC